MKLPKINKIVIENFSLYKLQRRIEIDVNDGVMCLAGANGLGKSTFISIVSYAMTGVVVQPNIDFKSLNSISEFVKKASGFADIFFEGRIDERDRMQAQVTVEFVLGDFEYSITREFFSGADLLKFSRRASEGNETVTGDDSLQDQYKNYFVQDSELSSFDQYIFIQTYVLTFDESKKLLFWDEDVMSRVMYLFFSIDSDNAQRADMLRKNIKRFESNMRNIQWEISKVEKRLGKLQSTGFVSEQEMNEIEEACNAMDAKQTTRDEKQSQFEQKKSKREETKLQIDNNALKQNEIITQYERLFGSLYTTTGEVIERDERIQYSLKQIILRLTENEDADIEDLVGNLRQTIVNVIKNKPVENEQAVLNELKKLDEVLSELRRKGDDLNETLKRLDKELETNKAEIEQLNQQIEQFAKINESILAKKNNIQQGQQVQKEIEALRLHISQLRKEKEEAENNRNNCQEELKPLDDAIKQRYSLMAETFIPTFQQYAKSFIGLDIDVEMRNVNGMLSLVVSVNGSDRRLRHQLSESQQYFLDIALRFSLIENIHSERAFMLIDTPEGSLDVAYESRAGKMFADFVKKGYSVIMTANINSSQLLLKLAELCGEQRMKLERMTEWTILTQVQQEEQSVIEDAYEKIEEKLKTQYA